jgi:hypothetical protein
MTGQTPEETCVHVDADANMGDAPNGAEMLDANQTKRQLTQTNPAPNPTKDQQIQTIRQLRTRPGRVDWLFMRHMVIAEGATLALVAQDYGICVEAIRRRRKKENWDGGLEQSNMPALEELLVMRSEREIAQLLRSMEKKRLAARQTAPPPASEEKAAQRVAGESTASLTPEQSAAEKAQAARPAEKPAERPKQIRDDPGGEARALQSLSRAIANTVTTRGKMKTKVRPPGARMRNLANIENAFQRIAAKARAAQNLEPEGEE